jgi:hypothetical protein
VGGGAGEVEGVEEACMVRTEGEREGDVATEGGKGKFEEGWVNEEKINQGFGPIVLPSHRAFWNCDREGMGVDPILKDRGPG